MLLAAATRTLVRAQASTSRVAQRALATHTEVAEFAHGPCFGLSEDQTSFQQLAREFTANEITTVAAEHDRTMAYPWEVIRKAHAAGLMNSTFSV